MLWKQTDLCSSSGAFQHERLTFKNIRLIGGKLMNSFKDLRGTDFTVQEDVPYRTFGQDVRFHPLIFNTCFSCTQGQDSITAVTDEGGATPDSLSQGHNQNQSSEFPVCLACMFLDCGWSQRTWCTRADTGRTCQCSREKFQAWLSIRNRQLQY